MESPEYEVIVVGAGIMGSSTAYFLSKTLGAKVLLLEQFDRLHKRGSSHGESRIIRMTYPEDFNTLLMFDAYKFWAEIEKESNTKLLTKTGGLCLGPKNHPGMQSVLKNMDKFSIPYEILTPGRITKKYPTIKAPNEHIAIFSADAGVLNASKSVATIQDLARKIGCVFLDNSPVSKIVEKKTSGGVDYIEVETPCGRKFTGNKCILTSGAWTGKLIREFNGLELPLQPTQTTVAYWKVDNPNAYAGDKFPIFINYDDVNPLVYGTPALEYPNMIKCAGDEAAHCDPDNRTFEPALSCINDAAQFLKQNFTGVAEKPTHTESCMYTMSPDRQFIIDVLPNSPNVFIGCGFSGHGFKLGPVVGKILSDLATSGKHPYPHVHQHFTVKRFLN